MIEKVAHNIGIDKIDVYYEDTKLDFFKIFDLSDYFSIGKNSFMINISENEFVQNTEIKVEMEDANGNPIFIDFPKYSEGELRRISIWIYPHNVNGEAKLTIVGELKNVPKQWRSMYNVRYSTIVNVNKALPNTQPIRFYDTPSASIEEYRRYYLERNWGSSEETIITGSDMSTKTTEKGEYLLNLGDNEFDYRFKGAKVTIGNFDPVSIKDVINKNLAILDVPYSYSSSYEKLSNATYSIEYENEPTYSKTENYQSYAKMILTGINPFSGEIKKAKTYLKSRGAFDNTEYKLINETEFRQLEMLADQEETGSTYVSIPTLQFSASAEELTFTGSIKGTSGQVVYFDWNDGNNSNYSLIGTGTVPVEYTYAIASTSHSISIYKGDRLTHLDLSEQSGLTGSINSLQYLINLQELYLHSSSANGDINIINNFPNLDTYSFYSSSINSYTQSTMLDFSSNNTCSIDVSNVNLISGSVDQFIIDLAAVPQTGTGSLTIDGNNEARTSASDFAIATLISTSWDVNYNEDRVPLTFTYDMQVDEEVTASFKGFDGGHIFVDWGADYGDDYKVAYSLSSSEYMPTFHKYLVNETIGLSIYNNFTHISMSDNGLFGFDSDKFPNTIESIYVSGSGWWCTSDLNGFISASELTLMGNNNSVTYTAGANWASMSYFRYEPSSSKGLTIAQVDDLIINMTSSLIDSGALWLAGENAARSSDSDEASGSLIARNWTLTANEIIL